MFHEFWKVLGRPALCGAALLAAANLAQAQIGLPAPPPGSNPVIPAVVQSAPPVSPILQIGAQDIPGGIPNLPTPPSEKSPIAVTPSVAPVSAILPQRDTAADELKARVERLEK